MIPQKTSEKFQKASKRTASWKKVELPAQREGQSEGGESHYGGSQNQSKSTPWWKPSCKNLGKRVFQEMAGNQAFTVNNVNQELLPWHDEGRFLPKRASVASTAKALGLTPYAVRKIMVAYEQGGEEEVSLLRWGAGRPAKNLFLSQEQLDHMVSKTTLNLQVGMSLKARALQYSQLYQR